jgi:hypothetical protein
MERMNYIQRFRLKPRPKKSTFWLPIPSTKSRWLCLINNRSDSVIVSVFGQLLQSPTFAILIIICTTLKFPRPPLNPFSGLLRHRTRKRGDVHFHWNRFQFCFQSHWIRWIELNIQSRKATDGVRIMRKKQFRKQGGFLGKETPSGKQHRQYREQFEKRDQG